MNDVEQFLSRQLEECGKYTLGGEECAERDVLGVAAYVQKLILRKPYRKWKAGDVFQNRLPKTIAYCIERKEPLVFRFWFGGYKLWRFASSPMVDWAEFFALAYYLEYLAPIAAAYPHGVVLEFCSDEVFVERLNNIPESETRAYTESFEKLIAAFTEHLPNSISIRYSLNRNLFASKDAFETELKKVVDTVKESWGTRRTKEEFERDIASSWLNIRFEGEGSHDLSSLSEVGRRAKAEEGLLVHDALGVLENSLIIDSQPNVISIFANAFPDSLGLGTTKNSMVKFWVGTGVLERKGGLYAGRILSWRQHEISKKRTDMTSVTVSISSLIVNFSRVQVFSEPFQFG